MNLDEATNELINSTAYRNIAKEKTSEGGKYRVMRQRYNKGELKALAMAELLIKHGYTITVHRPKKKASE